MYLGTVKLRSNALRASLRACAAFVARQAEIYRIQSASFRTSGKETVAWFASNVCGLAITMDYRQGPGGRVPLVVGILLAYNGKVMVYRAYLTLMSPKNLRILLANLFPPTNTNFPRGISMVLCLQRRHRRGVNF